MAIFKKNTLFAPELKTRFKVINVHWEPHAASEWDLQYKSYPVFYAADKINATKEEDEQLVGQEIEAHIYVSAEEKNIALKNEKSFSYKDGWVTVTGIVEDKIKCYLEDKDGVYEGINYKLNSVFPLEISALPKDTKIGDWVTVSGEASINLPQKR